MTPSIIVQLPKTHFGAGAIERLPDELRNIGMRRPMLLTDKGLMSCGIAQPVRELFAGSGAMFDAVRENPTIEMIDQVADAYRELECDGFVALGGGSVIDTAKGAAVVVAHGGSFAVYIGRPESIPGPIARLIAVPTTAGSGSESSPAAGVHPEDRRRAVGTRSFALVPIATICDPVLTVSLPPRLTAATGLDALGHCIEGFLASNSSLLLDTLALAGMRRAFLHLERAVESGNDVEARAQMLHSAWEGGAAITMGLGPAHALANTLGDRGLHHGALVAACLPPVLERAAKIIPEPMATVASTLGLARADDIAPRLRLLAQRTGAHPHAALTEKFVDADRDEMARDAAASPFNRTSRLGFGFSEYRELVGEILD
jgi:alcohol dehydrogenase class IV